MEDIRELFGSMVFNDKVMRERLPESAYRQLRQLMDEGGTLNLELANVVAKTMMEWAVEKGATHFTHWFQPMTGLSAEKHDSFITPDGSGGVLLEFSGKELIKGESDASSFPSGGLRATFEARGYTAWDPTSPAFIKDGVLCIPTAFCSYTGEALDKKTPLLRSMSALEKQALRVLKLFGSEAKKVTPTVGAEQEYFIVDRELYNRRKDLIYTGRTLFGAKPPKGQELDDYYFGFIKTRISAYMKDLNEELWRIGILARTEHNEAAPAQHELAPIHSTCNIATDHNQLTMELMRKVAKRHGLACLLHEKPFAGINGSGKHNNWSLATDLGANLLDPGDTPHENAQFLTFLCAVIKAVDEYQDLLRISVASGANDHRLGAAEAPPAIVSIYVGDELMDILNAIAERRSYDKKARSVMNIGVDVLPAIPRDSSDRNRTSPFAFTGNKFEFRMVGSSLSIAGPNTVLNTIVAESLRQFADRLEAAEDFREELNELIHSTVCEHRRILFGGNGYDESWVKEAESRGLSNLRSTDEAIPHLTDPKNVEVFTRHGVYTEAELRSRRDILLEGYAKNLNIEALTMLEMVRSDIQPAVLSYSAQLAETLNSKRSAVPGLACTAETELLTKISELSDTLYLRCGKLDEAVCGEPAGADHETLAHYIRQNVLPAMNELRETADALEILVAKDFWPFPSYGRLLYMV